MACGCNNCNDVGCLKYISTNCIKTDTAFSCIGTGIGANLTSILSAINTEFCKTTGFLGCTQTVNGTPIKTIDVTSNTVGTVTTYSICLSTGILSIINSVSGIANTVSTLSSNSGKVKTSNVDTCFDYLGNKIESNTLDITTPNTAGCNKTAIETKDWVYANITLTSPWTSFIITPQYGTQDGKSVKLRGVLSHPSGISTLTSIPVGTLPVGFRPSVSTYYTFVINDTSGLVSASISISTAGLITVDVNAFATMASFLVPLDLVFFTT